MNLVFPKKSRNFTKIAFVTATIFTSALAYGDPTALAKALRDAAVKSAETISINQYIRPNEYTPADAAPIYSSAPAGAHIYVGTERGFIGLSLAPNATFGIFADVNDRATKYNQINILLLRMAKDLNDYGELRYGATPEVWIARAKKAGIDAKELEIFSDRDAIRAWNKVNADYEESDMAPDPREERKSAERGALVPFENANYLHYQEQFDRIHALAESGRLIAINVDLRDQSAWGKIKKAFEQSGERISVVDISNAWEEGYIGHQKVDELRASLAPIAAENSKLVITKLRDKSSLRMWDYDQFNIRQSSSEFVATFLSRTVGCSALDGKFGI